MKAFILAILPALVAASPFGESEQKRDACNADNCLRAVRASKSFDPHSSDCVSYFKVTVTPATSTIYETLTFTTTPTFIQPVTYTDVIPETVSTTGTTTTLTTSVTTVKTTLVVTTTSTSTHTFYNKRQVTEVPSVIPTYASACSGAVRYSSACSCIGVTAETITADSPVTTVTVSTTETPTTVTVDSTVATVDATTVVATQTVIVTVTDVVPATVTEVDTTTTKVLATASATTTPLDDCANGSTYTDYRGSELGAWSETCDHYCPGWALLFDGKGYSSFQHCMSDCGAQNVGELVNFNYETSECQCYMGCNFPSACYARPGWNTGITWLASC